MNMPPSILENIQENYNIGYSNTDLHSDRNYSNYGNADNYVPPADYAKRYDSQASVNPSSTLPHHYASSVNGSSTGGGVPIAEARHTGSMQVINHMRAYQHENPYALKESLYERSRTLGYGTSAGGAESPYHAGHPLTAPNDLYSPPGAIHGMSFKSSVQSLLKNDYQQQQRQQYKHHQTGNGGESDRMSEGSDKNPYNFPYTAEEDHLVHNGTARMHHTGGMENIGHMEHIASSSPSPPQLLMRAPEGLSPAPLQSIGQLNGATNE